MKGVVVFVNLLVLIVAKSLSDDATDGIVYNFYNQKNSDKSVKIDVKSIEDLSNAGFDVTKKTVFVVYSFAEPTEIESKWKLKDNILTKDVNVFVVDWSATTAQDYISAQAIVTSVGQSIANFILAVKEKYALDLAEVIFIGWDLGAHVAGVAGKSLSGSVSTIIGLDPSAPLFTEKYQSNRLYHTDAKFVQVIHSNTLINGYPESCGHADYYPNGGNTQSSCGNDITGVCSHHRALTFYAESLLLLEKQFVALQCEDYESYGNGACEKSKTSIMGTLEVDTEANGNYYLNTNDHSPYGQG